MESPTAVRSGPKLLVGIDYGTTFSGLCFALSTASDFKDVKPWTAWPGGPSENDEHLKKAPSRIAYAEENEDLDHDAWGYEVEPGMVSYAWTKLLLDQAARPTEYDDPDLMKAADTGLMRLPPGKRAKDVVTDYMKGMYRMFTRALKNAGMLVEDEIALPMPIEYWVTVPAIWSEEAKWAIRDAAMDAGFGTRPGDTINLIAEPEAAAHLALKDSIRHVDDLVKEKTGVLVCDCGGGTVDITTYVVEKVAPTLKLREACVGVGGKCGGTYIDRNLHKLMTTRFGTAFTSLPPERTGPGSTFMQQFESKKRSFSSTAPSKRPAKLRLIMPELVRKEEDVIGYDKTYGEILLSHEDMKYCFDPVIDLIIDLVNSQVNAVRKQGIPPIETIVLVGGLGESPYVREKLFIWSKEGDMRLTTPWSGGWSATVCGAVLRGLEGSIVEKKFCRRHYGHSLSKKYDPLTDSKYNATKRRVWTDSFREQEMLSGYMCWEMAKGDQIDEETEIVSNFSLHFSEEDRRTVEHELYSCSLDSPPDSIDHERVEMVGTVKGSFADVDLSKLECKTDKAGKKHYQINLILIIQLGAKEGTLLCKLLMKGREIGKTTISFSYR
ncbi:hsp70-like protein [Glonium stellatum]|uniref:Hsp70-like protein n=1 Tax=Glonium stellatum TaxID=574774 RepID=A0A8E2FAS4_9PEZI|nr:hsp70-like protein [Glonium stellatum]